ncbi:hypothetical protein [Billgrantia desiderata]|uniref:hypothetical protein n=1 Tax=Billgrantia desiderata TaxID=52021 RepID=UPI001123B371|nr:hypothetical protein [Halomonas desiderata]
MVQKVLTQGHFDGFCLVYSIFNGYKSLTKPSQNSSVFAYENMAKWERVVNITPSLHHFASGVGSDFGVRRIATDIKLKRSFVEACFDVITEGSRRYPVVEVEDIFNLINIDFSAAVVILCVNENAEFEHGNIGDHWVVLVGRDEDSYLVACSYTLHQHGFQERVDEASGRYYNTKISASKVKKSTVYQNSICKISLEPR